MLDTQYPHALRLADPFCTPTATGWALDRYVTKAVKNMAIPGDCWSWDSATADIRFAEKGDAKHFRDWLDAHGFQVAASKEANMINAYPYPVALDHPFSIESAHDWGRDLTEEAEQAIGGLKLLQDDYYWDGLGGFMRFKRGGDAEAFSSVIGRHESTMPAAFH